MKKAPILLLFLFVTMSVYGQSQRQVAILVEMERFSHDLARFEDITKAAWMHQKKQDTDPVNFQIGTVKFRKEAFVVWVKNIKTTEQMMTKGVDELSQLVLYFQELSRVYDIYTKLQNDLLSAHLRSMDVSLRRVVSLMVEGKPNQKRLAANRLKTPGSKLENSDAAVGTISRYLKTKTRSLTIIQVPKSGRAKASLSPPCPIPTLDWNDVNTTNPERIITKDGIIVLVEPCYVTVRFADDTTVRFLVGTVLDSIPTLLNQPVTVRFDKTTGISGFIKFPNLNH